MNNQGKIIVNPNVSAKTFLLIAIFTFLMFAFFLANVIKDIIKTKDYVKVDAAITKVDYHLKSPDQTVEHYMEFSYKYDNNNYTGERIIIITFNKKVGKKIKIYINPNKPEEVRDTYLSNIMIFMTIIPLVIFIFSIYAYRTKKQNSNR